MRRSASGSTRTRWSPRSEDAWRQDSVVLVEMSDLVRADAFGLLSTPEQAEAALRQALTWTDALVGRLLAAVDLDRDAVVVVSPVRARNTVLGAVAVHAPGLPAGLLTSASTRRPGFVLLADVAPTVLGLAGLPREKDMTASRFTVGRAQPLPARLDALENSTDASVFRDQVRGPVTLGYAVLLAVVLGGAAWAMTRDERLRRWRTGLAIGALTALCYVPAVFLARLFPLHEAGTAAYWGFLAVASIGAAVVIHAATRRRADDAALVALGLIVAVLVIDVLTGARLQLNSAFGYSATVGIRVAGYGNVAYAMLGRATVLVERAARAPLPGRAPRRPARLRGVGSGAGRRRGAVLGERCRRRALVGARVRGDRGPVARRPCPTHVEGDGDRGPRDRAGPRGGHRIRPVAARRRTDPPRAVGAAGRRPGPVTLRRHHRAQGRRQPRHVVVVGLAPRARRHRPVRRVPLPAGNAIGCGA